MRSNTAILYAITIDKNVNHLTLPMMTCTKSYCIAYQ